MLKVNYIYHGNTFEILRTFPDECIDCVITSPPYWGLRDYGLEAIIWDADPNCEHKWRSTWIIESKGGLGHKQDTNRGSWFKNESQFCVKCNAWRGSLGLEPTPELYTKHLLEIFDEIKRVLKKSGTCWVNIGDSYGGKAHSDWNVREDYPEEKKTGGFHSKLRQNTWIGQWKGMPKSLIGVPEMFVLGMKDRGWIRRNTIIWFKPNCIPCSAKDRFTVDFEYIYFFTKSREYWFEQQFEPLRDSTLERSKRKSSSKKLIYGGLSIDNKLKVFEKINSGIIQSRNRRCVWTIPVQPFHEAHFATFPETLIEPMVRAGCPEFICKKCGKAKSKVFKNIVESFNYRVRDAEKKGEQCPQFKASKEEIEKYKKREDSNHPQYEYEWMSCNCNEGFESGIVLDPFCGSGTTLVVAEKLRRRWIGIELNEKYVEMANNRIGRIVRRILG